MRARPWRNLYSLARWKRARAAQFAKEPLCLFCKQEGKITAACVVDHITPHKGALELFWDPANLQSLCKPHHDRDKKLIEAGKKRPEIIGPDGYPIPRTLEKRGGEGLNRSAFQADTDHPLPF